MRCHDGYIRHISEVMNNATKETDHALYFVDTNKTLFVALLCKHLKPGTLFAIVTI